MNRAEEFDGLRPLLFAIAYRILGSVSEAEDAVQETWLRCQAFPTQPTSTKAFLSAVVTRISIDVLRSARLRREDYVGPWFPEPLVADPYEDPQRSAELADSLSMAALLLLERLTPLERGLRAAGGVRVRLPGDRVRRRTLGGGMSPAGRAGSPPHGRGPPTV
jgi:RNA polymerase sigma-70 factor (ECF subfamily)